MKSKPLRLLHDILHEYKDHPVAMDECHAMLIYGMILASKPYHLIEFGIGTGQLSRLILAALTANEKGYLTIVDNFRDWEGKRPEVADYLIERGANVIKCDQEEFIRDCNSNAYDMVISDANHDAEPKLLPEFLRIVKAGGTIFVHDANHEQFDKEIFENLCCGEVTSFSTFKYPYTVFNESSLLNERTARGLLMIHSI